MASGSRSTSIIAMKGAPFTRKTEFAHLIAKSLRCPILSLDDVLDTLHPDYFQSPPLSPSNSARKPRDLAFRILCDVAKSHLNGIFDVVVIDSPLSSTSHLDHLITLAKSLGQTRVVIVECKPKNAYSWQLKFERYLDFNPYYAQKWFKAKNWDEVEKTFQEDDAERLDGIRVSKLVLDPFRDGPQFNHSYVIIPSVPILFMEAVECMITRERGDGPIIVAYDHWRHSKYLHSTKEDNNIVESLKTSEQSVCRGGHCISRYSEQGLEYKANCMACDKQVNGAAYTCKDCTLALHKDCAESFDHNLEKPMEKFACTWCKSFSDKCASCLFKTHLKYGAMPTVIRHDCEEHFLSILISPVQDEVCRCAACGEAGVSTIFYSCKRCNLVYHYECLCLSKVPYRTIHVHGLYHHHMVLRFCSDEEEEDYLCSECQEKRDPQLWFYTCEDCEYEAHMFCVLPIKDKMPSFARTLSFVRKERLPLVVMQLLANQGLSR